MKRVFVALILFFIVFVFVIVWKFPYSGYISKALEDTNKSGDVKVTWSDSSEQLLAVVLKNVKVTSPQGELLALDSLRVTYTPDFVSGIIFKGSGSDTTLSGNYKNNKVNFDLRNYKLPAYLAVNVGEGNFDIKGSYDTKSTAGNADFKGRVTKIPVPMLSKPFDIDGNAVKKGEVTDIKFVASGNGISGEGSIAVSSVRGAGRDNNISGNINLKTGLISVKLRLSGTLNNIKMNVGL